MVSGHHTQALTGLPSSALWELHDIVGIVEPFTKWLNLTEGGLLKTRECCGLQVQAAVPLCAWCSLWKVLNKIVYVLLWCKRWVLSSACENPCHSQHQLPASRAVMSWKTVYSEPWCWAQKASKNKGNIPALQIKKLSHPEVNLLALCCSQQKCNLFLCDFSTL